jgi:hypothetical protein
VEEELFARREGKFSPAVDALEQPVLEFHLNRPRRLPRSSTNSSA